jgi:ADP-ribose pyrophosphatase YjhB (NUDIX family)
MSKACDHTSVGMLVWKEEKLLLIERAKFPFGFALPAGHVDGDPSFEVAAKRELKEEAGLEAEELKLVAEGRRDNQCRREGGTWHYWNVYEIKATGEIERSQDETKRAGWYSRDQIAGLAQKTERYTKKEISEEEWERSPGLEPVMYDWFKELKII